MDYDNYLKTQIENVSFESDHPGWRDGQVASIERFLIPDLKKTDKILDIACGDGVGVNFLYKRGFVNITGVDINQDKINRGKTLLTVPDTSLRLMDISKLDFSENYFDKVWCSHTLEHAYDPEKAIKELKRVSKADALFYFILPYPGNSCKVHCAAETLRLNITDGGKSCAEYISSHGLELVTKECIHIREPEIFLKFNNLA